MTRDYAKPSTTRKSGAKKGKQAKKQTRSSAGAPAPKTSRNSAKLHIALIVLIIGAFGFALFKLAQVPQTPETETLAEIEPAKPAKPKAKPEPETPVARFQFYDMLPQSEVDTDTVEAYTFKEKGIAEEYQYMIQTGSFRSAQDAERQKATIAFQGLKASINQVRNENGSTWHRVETGPYLSRSEMNAALDKLYAINIQPLVKKSKK